MSDYLDRFGRGQSMCHRWPPFTKLFAVVAMILAATCVPITHGPLVGIVACVIFFAHTLARIPLAYVGRRLLIFWPPLFLMAISLPLSSSMKPPTSPLPPSRSSLAEPTKPNNNASPAPQPTTAESQARQKGWLLFVTILVRGTLSFSTALWLVNVMPFDQLLATLRRLRVPDVLLAILSLMYRFLFVLWDELDRMRTARSARLFRKPSLWETWRSAAHLVGRLLIRALDRADRIHGAMLARGWDGRSRWIEPRREDRP